MRQPFFQAPLHRLAVNDERVHDIVVARRKVVIVVSIGVEKLDDGATAIECRRHRELQQIVGEKDSLAGGNHAMQTSKDGVEILHRRLELEGRLILGVECAAESSVRRERVMREYDAIGKPVRPSMSEEAFDDIECPSDLIGKHRDDARWVQGRHARMVATQLSERFSKGDCTCAERHGSGVNAFTSNTKPAAASKSNIAPVCRLPGFDS